MDTCTRSLARKSHIRLYLVCEAWQGNPIFVRRRQNEDFISYASFKTNGGPPVDPKSRGPTSYANFQDRGPLIDPKSFNLWKPKTLLSRIFPYTPYVPYEGHVILETLIPKPYHICIMYMCIEISLAIYPG